MKTSTLFLGAIMCANLAFAQTEAPTTANEGPEEPTEKVKKVADVGNEASSQRLVGPAAKNPLAAGRAGSSATTPPAVTPPTSERLTGPAYKNRKLAVRPNTDEIARATVRKRGETGPRYKNRTAKTGKKVIGRFRRH
jgi:hypothetical protein